MLLYLTIMSCFMFYAYCEEPRDCSQFYYVDKLLDKMIRMEVKVENVDKEITGTNSDVHSTLGELKREQGEFRNDFLELKKQLKDDIENIKREREEFQSELKKQMTDDIENTKREREEFQSELNKQMTDDIENTKREREEFRSDFLELKIEIRDDSENIKGTLVTPNVMFKARTVKDKTLGSGQAFIFTENMFNYGDGYDNTTGIFTAPISGTYLFTFHLCVNNQNNLYYGIVYDNIVHTSGRFYDTDDGKCYTADGMLPLTTGQKVWIKCLYSTTTLFEHSTSTYNYWNTFSGMLIH